MNRSAKWLLIIVVGIIVILTGALFVQAEKTFKTRQAGGKIIDDFPQLKKEQVNLILTYDKNKDVSPVVLSKKVGEFGRVGRHLGKNTYAIKVNWATYEKLKSNRDYSVEIDLPVHAFLNDSVKITNITRVRAGQLSGTNITGAGQTICIIDTGINYTHADLGSCNGGSENLSSSAVSYNLSYGPYANLYNNTWKINVTGFSKISLHFLNASTELGFDFVNILNGSNTTIASYSGSHSDLWTPSSDGDTIYVNLISDESINGSGFGIDQVVNGTASNTYDGSNCKVAAGWDFVNNDADPYDDQGHGTHVAGIAAGNGTSLRGAAPDARIISIKVLDAAGSGTTSDIISGINWCVGNATKYNITVISMSLGGGLNSTYCDSSQPSTATAINTAVANNISVVIATGNNGATNGVSSPACIENATRVGSTDKDGLISSFTNTGSFTILLAPGGSINSTDYGGGYSTKSGTSMATPLVAGSFALAYQTYQNKFGSLPEPGNLTTTFNRSGVPKTDVNGITYARIDVLAAIGTWDKQTPSITLTSPSNGSGVKQGAIITVNMSDDLSKYYATYSRNGTANVSLPTNGQVNTSSWSLGNNTLAIYAWDLFDKYSTTTFQFDILNGTNTKPTVSNVVVNPASATKNNNLICNYTYSDADGDAEWTNTTIFKWYLNRTVQNTLENASTLTSGNVTKLQTWNCEIAVFDGSDFGTTVNSTNITISDIAPNVGVVYPNTTAKVSGIIQLNASATDEDGQNDVDIVYFYYTNSSTWTLIGNVTSGSGQHYNFTWNTSAIADGAGYQVRASVFDGVNTTNATSAVSFVINNINEKPTVTVTAPNGGESWSGTKTITWTASDPDNETLTATLYYSKNSGVNWTQIASGEANDGSYDWDTKTVGNANSYRINVSVVDSSSLSLSDMSDSDFTVSNSADSGGGGGGGSTTGGGDSRTAAGGGGGGAGLGGNQAGSTYATVAAGDLLTLDVTKDLAITNVELTSKSVATNVKLTVEKFDEQPSALASPVGVAYKFSEIKAANLPSDAFDSVTIKFKVPKTWIKENKIDESTIALQRYSGGWQGLSTTKTGEDSDNLRFTATSPGLSFFAITGKKILTEEIPIETESLSETNETAGAAIVGGLATGLTALKLPKLDLTGFTSAISDRKYFLPNGLWVLVGVLAVVLVFYGVAAARKPRTPKDVFRQDIQKKYGHEMRALKAGREGAQKFFGRMLKWAFTDTKQAKEITERKKLEENKNKERPDFGF